MKARISCTPKVRNLMSNIASAANVNYDEFLRYLLANAGIDIDLTEYQARAKGIELYKDIQEYKED